MRETTPPVAIRTWRSENYSLILWQEKMRVTVSKVVRNILGAGSDVKPWETVLFEQMTVAEFREFVTTMNEALNQIDGAVREHRLRSGEARMSREPLSMTSDSKY